MTDPAPCPPANDHLVFIETSGNQAYLFATNKLKENVGASELTWRVGAQWAGEAARKHGASTIIETSGKAMFRSSSAADGQAIVEEVTERALREAPGLQVAGAVVPIANDETDAVRRAHKAFNANRDLMVDVRAPVLPWSEPCATSGLPAVGSATEGPVRALYSAASLTKRGAAQGWWDRMRKFFCAQGAAQQELPLFIGQSLDALQTRFMDSQWLGVVYSDGNGLGQIFMNLDGHLERLRKGGHDLGSPLEVTREFSEELEHATERAFYRACQHIGHLAGKIEESRNSRRGKPRLHIPVIPLILAGDDVAALVQGEYALPFAREFLLAFEQATRDQAECPTITRVAETALGAARLSAGAGVALVKHHFPFHLAHEIAEKLLRSSKDAKRRIVNPAKPESPYPASALDFHVLFDASYTDLDLIRGQRLTVDRDRSRLYGGPYLVTPLSDLQGTTKEGRQWAEAHHLDHLLRRVKLLNDRDAESDRLRLPSSQMHALREILSQGKDIADQRLGEFARYNELGLDDLLEATDPSRSLFQERDGTRATRFVDALNSAGFWGIAGDSGDQEIDCRTEVTP
jgi:hypothetical protein